MRSAHARAWLVVSLALAFLPGAFLGNPQIVAYVTLSQSVAPSTGDDNLSFESSRGQADNALSGLSFPEHFAMAYDAQSDRVVLFGFEETLSYDLETNTWTNMNPNTKPSYREYPGMAYDSQSDRVILFGGWSGGGGTYETWAYDFESNTWTNMNPDRNPGCRYRHSMAYDSQSDRVILYGGAVGCFEYGYVDGETWAYDFEANEWTYMTSAGPFAWYHAMAYDSQADRVILFSGDDVETWAYDIEANLWTNLGPASQPCGFCAMAYDSQSDRVIMFDGETWAYDYETNMWTNMNPDLQPSGGAMAYDSHSDRVILASGHQETWAYHFETNTWTNVGQTDVVWIRQFGTRATDFALDVAVDRYGVYVVGRTGGTDFFRKYDKDGNVLWTRQSGASGGSGMVAVAVDPSGVYVTGSITGALPGETSAGFEDAFLRKYDPDGNVVWTRQFGTSGSEFGNAVALDASGIYVAGSTSGTFPGETSSSPGDSDVFVRKYDTDGNVVWTRQFGWPYSDAGSAVAVTPPGVYVVGSMLGLLPDERELVLDAFIRKYDAGGNAVWTHEFGTSTNDFANAVAVDPSGVYVAGTTGGALPGETSAGFEDAFLRKYDPDGNVVWTRQFGTSAGDGAQDIVVDPSGASVVGWRSGDAFVRKYKIDGTEVWTRLFGSGAPDAAWAVAVDPSGVYVAGTTGGALPGETSAGGQDAFIARLHEMPEGVPGAPVNLQAIPGDERVTISWQAPESGGGSPITGYRIYRGTSLGDLALIVEVGNVLTYMDTGLTNGVRYYYQVSAVNAIGEGPRSAEVSVTVGDLPPVVRVPGPIVAEATGPSGATVDYVVTAVDDVDGSLAAVCSPASASVFPVGTTIVTCTARDSAGNEATAGFTVEVRDSRPPVLTVPADIQVAATGLSGAAVTFDATATDLVDSSPVVSCSPSSGSTFGVGTTTVMCTTTDSAGNAATASFRVTVTGPPPPPPPPIPLWVAVAAPAAVALGLGSILLLRRRSKKAPPPS